MSEQPLDRSGLTPDEQWEARLVEIARTFPYPPTPDVAGAIRQRRTILARGATRRALILAAIVLLALLCGLLAVPQVRAAVLNLLRIGSVIIIPVEPTATPTPLPPTPAPSDVPTATITPTPIPTPTLVPSLRNLAGPTTLAKAQAGVNFHIRLPAYPPDLGAPDKVYLQDVDAPIVILVWLDPKRPGGVRLSLHLLADGALVYKMAPKVIKETVVDGQPAIWTEGPYVLQVRHGNRLDWDMRRIMTGHALIWTEDMVTYRLETDLSIQEALRIAESVR